MEKIVVQKIIKKVPDLARRYFNVVAVINGLALTKRDVDLLSFVAEHGNISEKGNRKEFCVTGKTTMGGINNVVSKLKRMGMIVKVGGSYPVGPGV